MKCFINIRTCSSGESVIPVDDIITIRTAHDDDCDGEYVEIFFGDGDCWVKTNYTCSHIKNLIEREQLRVAKLEHGVLDE
jgi:hypothetical protein